MRFTARVRVIVIDGITIGHPCCSVRNCKISLEKQHHRFCPAHDKMKAVCAIKDCSSPIFEGHLVCSNVVHLEVEKQHCLRGQARIRSQQQRHGVSTVADRGVPPGLDGKEVFDVDENDRVVNEESGPVVHFDKPANGNKHLRAQFGRRRTHNEQLIVAPCGVIIARSTFFGSEAVSSVRVSFILIIYVIDYLLFV